ncbi:MAG: hypothetical protein QM702_12995 [Rubrivivax sp.]
MHTPIQVGRYTVSPLTRHDIDGYAASVSIRSGSGRATHDRVLRLLPRFTTRDAAAHHATTEGLAWVARTEDRNAAIDTEQEHPWPRKN